MAMLQELDQRQIDEVITAATQRRVPATVTIRCGDSWTNLRSRMLALSGEHLWIAPPVAEGHTDPRDFSPADKIGLSFKLKHHKHIFTATVAGMEEMDADGRGAETVLSVCSPTRMHRLQRRAFLRVAVPPNRIVRAAFWLGGCYNEPAGTSPESPVWSGRVTDLSAGGFQVMTKDDSTSTLDIGDTIGVRLIFGAGQDAVFADAQFRHLVQEGETDVLGFQFLGLAHSEEGRKALKAISSKVAEFHHIKSGDSKRHAHQA